ncbi:efflux RND transporter periplasmic adaptor subunit [Flavobacterium sp. xlx-214]|uniref:efflux RND transporter periplasmic adaptor subunit n=1 Tax=unclassified Flavobacterium TaxID=196869 RepID=UPI0013D29A71|nr:MULTISPECIES: efflux RND transporter periplasmic adaptor subunit [unclassified Flavobacterium]MBA5791908.1 efflux RND transporter periplasmic adaptor subunit [Flavobacterium sp. xlx-221]QMI84164.1 efflux RND transporter periplasmic adaptor subunit [Flavobacterium sp. xlx-214]
MKSKLKTLLMVIVGTSIVGCSKKDAAPQAQAPMLDVVSATTKDVVGYTAFPATIQGKINNDVRAKIQGYIQEVYVHEGQVVSKGQPLFRLEANNLAETASAAKSGISVAQANVNVAQVEVDKLVPLVQKGIISSVQLETAKANLASSKSMLAQARANYGTASANVDYSVVRAPISGVVGQLPLKKGSLVGPADPTALTTIADVSSVYAYFSMNEKEYFQFLNASPGTTMNEKIKNLPQVELQLADGSIYTEKGKIETVSGQIDAATGTVQFRVAFSNPNKLLSNGNSGTIRLPKKYTNVLVVPEVASYEQQGKINVYKVVNDTAISVVVDVVDRVDNMIIVKEGVKEGETIIVSGVGSLRNKTAIKPKQVNFDTIVNAIKPVF